MPPNSLLWVNYSGQVKIAHSVFCYMIATVGADKYKEGKGVEGSQKIQTTCAHRLASIKELVTNYIRT